MIFHDLIKPHRTGRMVLVHPPVFSFESFDREVLLKRGYYCYPPRSLQCLHTATKDLIDSDILDLNFLMLKRLREKDRPLYSLLIELMEEYLETHPQTRIFGVSTGVIVPTFFDPERHPFLELLSHLMKREGVVIAGGAAATVEARNLIEGNWAHLVLKGEAELRMRYLLNPEEAAMSGICYFDGEYKESSGSSEMVNFQQSLIPSYQKLPIEEYSRVGCLSPFSKMVDAPYCPIQLIRGCRMKCSFCGLSQYRGSNEVKTYCEETLLDEIRYLYHERGIRHFSWLDEDLLAGKAEVKNILRQIIDDGIQLTWSAPTGLITVYVDEELLELAAKSGCVGFRLGIESGNPDILRQIKKPGKIAGFLRASELLEKYPQLFTCGLYMLGFEGETYHQMMDTLNFSIKMNLSWSHWSVYQDIKETNLRKPSRKAYNDWLPSPEKKHGASSSHGGNTQLTGKDLYRLPKDLVPDAATRQELWFGFNLISNYLLNKNLRPGGRTRDLNRWLRGLEMSYPKHPIISILLAVG